MPTGLFVSYRDNIIGEGTHVDFDTDTIKAMFVDETDDTPVLATDDAIDDILSAGRVPAIGSCPTLGSKTIGVLAAGVADAADTVFTALTGDQVEDLILFKDTGSEPTSLLISCWASGGATGLPLTPNSADVTVQWNASGIYQV